MLADSIVALEGGSYTMSTDDTFIKQQWQDQEALHRFQLISPLPPDRLDDARRLQLRRTIADENNISVRTLYRYEKAFAEKQFAVSDRLTVKSIVPRVSWKTLSFSGPGCPAPQGSSGTVSCPDHLHSGSRRSCGSRHSEALNP